MSRNNSSSFLNDGWDDDYDFDHEEENEVLIEEEGEGWDFEDDDDDLIHTIDDLIHEVEEGIDQFNHLKDEDDINASSDHGRHQKDRNDNGSKLNTDRTHWVTDQLNEYLNLLHSPHILEKLNHALTQKINRSETANELFDYYSSRPNLKSYTLQTELPRMKYTVYPHNPPHPSVQPISNVHEIQALYDDHESNPQHAEQRSFYSDLLWRAANQSLLADALSTLSHPLEQQQQEPLSSLVRPDLFISAIAQHCHFTLHFHPTIPHKNILDCTCDLLLQIPNIPHASFANLKLNICFIPFSIPSNDSSPEQMTVPQFSCQATNLEVFSISAQQTQQISKLLVRDYIPPSMSPNVSYQSLHSMQSAGHPNDVFGRSLSNTILESITLTRDSLISSTTATAIATSTQNKIADTGQGLKSALHQMDSVVNIKSKWNFLQNVLPVLPSAELLKDCEEEHEDYPRHPAPPPQHHHTQERNEFSSQQNKFQLYHRENDTHPPRPPPPPPPPSRPSNQSNEFQFYRRETNDAPNTNTKEGFKLYRRDENDEPATSSSSLHSLSRRPTNEDNEFQLYRRDDEIQHDVAATKHQPHPHDATKQDDEFRLHRRELDETSKSSFMKKPNAPPPPPPPPSARNIYESHKDEDDPLNAGLEDEGGWSDDELDLNDHDNTHDDPAENKMHEKHNKATSPKPLTSLQQKPPPPPPPSFPLHRSVSPTHSKAPTPHLVSTQTAVRSKTLPPPPPPPPPPPSVTNTKAAAATTTLPSSSSVVTSSSNPHSSFVESLEALSLGMDNSFMNSTKGCPNMDENVHVDDNMDGIIETRKRWVRPKRRVVF